MPTNATPRRHPAENARAVALGLAVGGFGAIAVVVGVSQAGASTTTTTATKNTATASVTTAATARPTTTVPSAAVPSSTASRRAHTTSRGS